MNNILEVQNVSKYFTGHTALDNVSLSVPKGSVYGLLGPNGAGKTTLIRIINHITAPDEGTVLFDGHRLVEDDVASIGYLPEERGLYKKMKVGEQAVFFAMLKGMSRREATIRLKEWFEKFEILDWWNKKVEELSKGMAQKVQFIVTVLHRPKLLIFDEPFSGFDPINANLLKEEILSLHREGATVIFSTHNMASVEALCDEITLINNSHNILTGNVNEIRNRIGGNRTAFVVGGDVTALSQRLGEFGLPTTVEGLDNGDSRLLIKRGDSVPMRSVIEIVNSMADIRSIEPAMPSMEEIFIETVKSYNTTHNIHE
ncbi:MAG: ATP-binding cassette domain-containing protein [Muribaculaceae bacterium]|nr:ATP-binding cassette domain-containing protein [Muribaculaceae bacterium]